MKIVERVVESDGVKIAAAEYGGSGPPLLLLHGGGRNIHDWDATASHLLDQFSIYAMDQRGHGQTTGTDQWSNAGAVRDVRAVVDAFGLGLPMIAGHSLGGMVAGMYAAEHDCAAIVNVDGYGAGPPTAFEGIDPEDAERWLTEIEEKTGETEDMILSANDFETKLLEQKGPVEAAGFTWEKFEPSARRGFVRGDDGMMRQSFSNSVQKSLRAELKYLDLFASFNKAKCPIMMVNATDRGAAEGQDELIKKMTDAFHHGIQKLLAELQSRKDNVVVKTLPTNHMIPLTMPKELAELIRGFAKDIGYIR